MRRSAAPTLKSLLAGMGMLMTPLLQAQVAPSRPTPPPVSSPASVVPVAASISLKSADCRATLETLKTDFAREPGRILLAVEDALTTQETCACPIVRTAVSFAGSDSALIGQIVITAIRAVPGAAARITECAITQSPESAEAIRAALAKELGGPTAGWLDSRTSPEPSDPQPQSSAVPGQGKNPAATQPFAELQENSSTDEESWPTVGISGIYSIFSPVNRVRTMPGPPLVHLEQVFSGKKKTVQRPILPVTRNIPE